VRQVGFSLRDYIEMHGQENVKKVNVNVIRLQVINKYTTLLHVSATNRHSQGDFSTKEYIILTLRRLMSYIYGAPILDVSRSHTTTQHSR